MKKKIFTLVIAIILTAGINVNANTDADGPVGSGDVPNARIASVATLSVEDQNTEEETWWDWVLSFFNI